MPKGETLSIKSASIVEFEFENILFSVKVKWSGGEEYFSPWSIGCDAGAVFSYKSLKARNEEEEKIIPTMEAALCWNLHACLECGAVCLHTLVPNYMGGLLSWSLTKTEFCLFM